MGRVVKVPPGYTIEIILRERLKISVKEFSTRMLMTLQKAEELLAGAIEINHDIALRLEKLTGFSATYWETRQKLYREYLLSQIPKEED